MPAYTGRLSRRIAIVAGCTLLVACQDLLQLHHVDVTKDAAPDAAADPCAPLPFDQLRYHAVAAGSGLSVSAARLACEAAGFELVSFDANDGVELTNELAGAPYDYWTGLSHASGSWANPDACPAAMPWRPGEPSSVTVTSCGLMTAAQMVSAECGTSTYPDPIGALCETPRPSPACLAQQSQHDYYLAGMTGTYSAVATACGTDGHIVEIDSGAELTAVRQFAAQNGISQFWLDPIFTSGTWTTLTGCPAVFAWAPSQPMLPNGNCVQLTTDGMSVHPCTLTTAPGICEHNP